MALRAKRYFRDYESVEVHKPDGSTERELRYLGDYRVKRQSARRRKVESVLFAVLGALSFALVILAIRQNVENNRIGVFASIGLVAMLPSFCVLVGGVMSLFAPERLTGNAYTERIVLLRVCSTVAEAFCLALTVGYALNASRVPAEHAGCVTACILTALACIGFGVICVLEWRTGYARIKGERETGEPVEPEQKEES